MQKHQSNTIPKSDWIWVFGCSEDGKHNKGASKIAHVNFRAEYGRSKGMTGNAYAIPIRTKSGLKSTEEIGRSISDFFGYAKANPKKKFFISEIGFDEDDFNDEFCSRLFRKAPDNCSIPEIWLNSVEA